MAATPEERFGTYPRIIQATMLRISRRIFEGFTGEITISVRKGGVHYIKWTETEQGDEIKEELG